MSLPTMSTVVSAAKAKVTSLAQAVDLEKLEGVVVAAVTTGGGSAVVPALITNVSTYITDPTEAEVVKLGLEGFELIESLL